MRVCSFVIVAAVCLGATTAALARDRRQIHSRVDLTTGVVTVLSAPATAATALTTPRVAPVLVASYGAGVVMVRTVGGKDQLKLAVGKLDHEWMPWSFFQPGLFVFDWRDRVLVPGKPDTIRDVLRVVDLATGVELWRRENAGAAPVGDRRLIVNTGAGFDLVDSRTGKLERHLALAGGGPSALAISGGDTLIDTGQTVARFDAGGAIVWQIDNLAGLVSITPLDQPAARYRADLRDPSAPLPVKGPWLVLAKSRLAVIDPVAGKVRWSAPSTSTSVLLDGTQVFTTEIARDPTRTSVTLTVRELATGKVARSLELVRETQFWDSVTAVIVARRGNVVDVTSELVVLD